MSTKLQSRPRIVPSIQLQCTFCKGPTPRGEVSYCASCLAPHHQSCFQEMGGCSILGCEETAIVRPHPNRTVVPAQQLFGVYDAATTALLMGVLAILTSGLLSPLALVKGYQAKLLARRAHVPTPSSVSAALFLGWLTFIPLLLVIGLLVALMI